MRFSIRKKTIAMILSFAIVLIAVSTFLYAIVMWNKIEDYYLIKADEESGLIAANVDAEVFSRVRSEVDEVFQNCTNRVGSEYWGTPEFDEYVAQFEHIKETQDFKTLHDFLTRMQDVTTVKCAYLAYVDVASRSAIYVVDADPEEPCPPGCFDHYFDDDAELFSDLSIGFPAYISNTEYGWLVTSGTTVYDASGQVVGYAVVDISMNEVRSEVTLHVFRLVLTLVLVLILLCVIGVLIVNRVFIVPIKQLSDTAADYCGKNSSDYYDGFSKLNVRTGDEIEQLADSMKRMEHDLNARIADILTAKGEAKRSRHLADEMTQIANKDALTGVGSKTAYDSEVEKLEAEIRSGDARFGIVMIDLNGLKKANDTYGHERGDELIKGISAMICEAFAHSPVFRVGGDEFVVIVTKSQYDDAESIIAAMNEKIETLRNDTSLEPWERISAAIGYAAFDPGKDTSVASVFRRADESMYERKREMKKKK